MKPAPRTVRRTEEAVDFLVRKLGRKLRIGTPLGLGKPNRLLNLLYDRALKDPSFDVTLFTALSLNPPEPEPELARRFFDPFKKRFWGADYPVLQYARDAVRNQTPPNVKIHEFYFQAGTAMNSESLQRRYQSINYTHVAEALVRAEVQVIVQLIARRVRNEKTSYSLACNPDVTLDLADLYRRNSKDLLIVGVVHPQLPFTEGEADVPEHFFDLIVDDPATDFELFGLPRLPIGATDHLIGFYASQLIPDDSTLQIGIGSLSEAVTAALVLRQRDNAAYRRVTSTLWEGRVAREVALDSAPFEKGIYGLSEMVTDGYMHLRRAGILKREVIDEKSGQKTFLHGAFYLGSKEFYAWIRDMSSAELQGLRMSRVSKINDLYDPNELLLRKQRKNARFLNTCMQVTLLGGAASETLEDGSVVSGVGGQYNFVAMSAELQHSKSILMLRSTRKDKGRRASNIVWNRGQLTIPRHLRDTVITEYGIADLKGRSDEEVIQALICIADSEFQNELIQTAKENGKLARDYVLPDWAKDNTPGRVKRLAASARQERAFAAYPFGSDFTPEEERIAAALSPLNSTGTILRALGRSFFVSSVPYTRELDRMGLSRPRSIKERLYRRVLLGAFQSVK